jgi:FAD linked oxidases, C-terminal domain
VRLSSFAHIHPAPSDLTGAIELAGGVVDYLFRSGEMIWRGFATTILVEALLRRDSEADPREAQAAIDRLAAVPTDPGFVLNDISLLRLRALLARAHGDEPATCRFTHVYPDGPAPYYGIYGATITHHHAVGRDHRTWYDRQRPEPFAAALRAVKTTLDPAAIMNPGVLIDVGAGSTCH